MAVFRYRMQNILAIKEKLETQAKMDYARAAAALQREEEHLRHLRDRKAGYEEEYRQRTSDVLHVSDIQESQEAISRMDDFILTQMDQVKQAEVFLEHMRVALQEAMQERQTYEKLREKAFEEFMAEERAKESKEIDELTSYVASQKRGSRRM